MPNEKSVGVGLSGPTLRPPTCAAGVSYWLVELPNGTRVWFREGYMPVWCTDFELLAVAWKVQA